MVRFTVVRGLMLAIALTDIRFWLRYAYAFYAIALILLIAVEFAGTAGMGAHLSFEGVCPEVEGIGLATPRETIRLVNASADLEDWGATTLVGNASGADFTDALGRFACARIAALDESARKSVEAGDVAAVDAAGAEVNAYVAAQVGAQLDAGKLVGVVGGDHAIPFGAIQTALIAKLRSGKGDHIDITMLESTMMLIPGQQQSAQKIDAPRIGGFQPIATKGGFLMLCIVSDKNMKGLCEAIDRPDLLQDERFVRGKRLLHMSDFIDEVEKWSNVRELGECEDRFDEHGVPYSRYNAPEQLFAEPQLRHRGAFREMVDEDGDYLIQNAPFQFQSFDNRASQSCATAGEHTDSILKSQAKLKQAEIDKLRRDGIIE